MIAWHGDMSSAAIELADTAILLMRSADEVEAAQRERARHAQHKPDPGISRCDEDRRHPRRPPVARPRPPGRGAADRANRQLALERLSLPEMPPNVAGVVMGTLGSVGQKLNSAAVTVREQ